MRKYNKPFILDEYIEIEDICVISNNDSPSEGGEVYEPEGE